MTRGRLNIESAIGKHLIGSSILKITCTMEVLCNNNKSLLCKSVAYLLAQLRLCCIFLFFILQFCLHAPRHMPSLSK